MFAQHLCLVLQHVFDKDVSLVCRGVLIFASVTVIAKNVLMG